MLKANIKLTNILQNAGLTEKEIQVYFALLSLGKGTVSVIARKAGINRTTGYDILDSLVGKDLVSVSGKEPKQEFVAESPENLREFLKREIEKKNETLKEIENSIPELKSIHNVSNRPKVLFYEGRDGLEKVYEDTFTSEGDMYATSDYEEMHETLPKYFETYYQRRAAKGIFIHAFVADTPIAHIRKANDAIEARETYLVPKDKFPTPTDIEIYGDKVMFASWKEKLGIIIESKEISTTLRSVFKLALEEAKRLDSGK